MFLVSFVRFLAAGFLSELFSLSSESSDELSDLCGSLTAFRFPRLLSLVGVSSPRSCRDLGTIVNGVFGGFFELPVFHPFRILISCEELGCWSWSPSNSAGGFVAAVSSVVDSVFDNFQDQASQASCEVGASAVANLLTICGAGMQPLSSAKPLDFSQLLVDALTRK